MLNTASELLTTDGVQCTSWQGSAGLPAGQMLQASAAEYFAGSLRSAVYYDIVQHVACQQCQLEVAALHTYSRTVSCKECSLGADS